MLPPEPFHTIAQRDKAEMTVKPVAASQSFASSRSVLRRLIAGLASPRRKRGRLERLRWKFNRLRMMDMPEIAWRITRAAQTGLAIWRHLHAAPGVLEPTPACTPAFGLSWLHDMSPDHDPAQTVSKARRILAGRFDVFALRDVALGFPPNWNRDPKTGVVAPLRLGMVLDYRDPTLVGDIKYLWEPNRHHELVLLARAWRLTADATFADGCRQLLDSWLTQVPYPFGQGWASPLENAIRLINWSIAWHLLGGADSILFAAPGGDGFRQRWLDCIYRHCDFIATHLSLHSSANNHLMGEYAGLFAASHTWPCWTASAEWQHLSRQGIETQALVQVGADGVHREQAIWYHHEVADMLLLCCLVAITHGHPLAPACMERLEGMCDVISSLMDAGGHVPMIGDADDATLRLSCEAGFDPYRSLLASGAVLFGRVDFAAKAGYFDDKSRLLLGAAGVDLFARLRTGFRNDPCVAGVGPPRKEPQRVFADAGYYLLGADFDSPSEVRIVADAGALGYLSIAAHGHADALSFTLSAGGRPLLIDPGTFAYHTQESWRTYFRSTAAHNTACIDSCNQSEIGGAFLWLHKAHATCEVWRSTLQEDFFIGSHDGYLRLPDPLLHRRTLRYAKDERVLVVNDLFVCRGTHEVSLHWHFSEQCDVRLDAGMGSLEAVRDGVRLQAWMPAAAGRVSLVRGRTAPPLGWISYCFDSKLPSPTAVWQQRIHGTTRCTTRFRIDFT